MKHQDVAGRSAPRQPVSSSPSLSIYDGRDAVGTVELIDGRHVAIDATGKIVGAFDALITAARSLPARKGGQ